MANLSVIIMGAISTEAVVLSCGPLFKLPNEIGNTAPKSYANGWLSGVSNSEGKSCICVLDASFYADLPHSTR